MGGARAGRVAKGHSRRLFLVDGVRVGVRFRVRAGTTVMAGARVRTVG